MKLTLILSVCILTMTQLAWATPVCQVSSYQPESSLRKYNPDGSGLSTFVAFYGSGSKYHGVWSYSIDETIERAVEWKNLKLCRSAYWKDKCTSSTRELSWKKDVAVPSVPRLPDGTILWEAKWIDHVTKTESRVVTSVYIGENLIGNFNADNDALRVIEKLRDADLCN